MGFRELDTITKKNVDNVFAGLSDAQKDEAGYLWDEGFWYNLFGGEKKLQWLADKLSDGKVNTDSVAVWRYVEQKCSDCY